MDDQSKWIKVREAIVAGIFYPEDPSELGAAVHAHLAEASPPRTDAQAVLSPHAGFSYSGNLEALAWKAASGRRIDTVVIIAPRHRLDSSEVYLPESDFFETPLGSIPVDRAAIEELESCGMIFRMGDIPHFEEHSIEVQLPFMRSLFPEASLVPVLTGTPGKPVSNALACALDLVFYERMASVLFVVSTDLASSADAREAGRRSDAFLESIRVRNTDAMLVGGEGSPCGSACVATILSTMILRDASWTLLQRIDSRAARANPDEKIVHYAAGAWFPGV